MWSNAMCGLMPVQVKSFNTIDMDKANEKMKLGDLAELWMAERGAVLKRSSLSTYRLIVNKHLIPAFGECEDVGDADVSRFIENLKGKGCNAKTVRDYLAVLRMIVRWAEDRCLAGHIRINSPIQSRQKQAEIQVLTVEEERKLLRYLRSNLSLKNIGVWMSVTTGMRIGEICALQWCDIDLKNKLVRVNRTVNRIYRAGEDGSTTTVINLDRPKTSQSERTVPLSMELVKKLVHLKAISEESNYVITNSARPTEPAVYRRYYNRMMEKLGLPGFKFHTLRHTFATRCVECNVDYKVLSHILGHADIGTTLNTYVHPSEKQKHLAVNKMLRSVCNGLD